MCVFHNLRALLLCLLAAVPVVAGPPSDVLLPRSTKGYVAVARPAEFNARWDKTQLGQMFNDPTMQTFTASLRKQLQDKYRALKDKLGITWDDLEGVPAGEMSLSLIDRPGKDTALAITIDVTGHAPQAAALLATVEKRFAARGGRKETVNRGGAMWQVFTVPGEAGSPPQQTVYFIKDNVLCGIDDMREAAAIAERFAGNGADSLRSLPAYAATMAHCEREAGALQPEARWFVEPFGFIFAARTLQKSNVPRIEQDVAKILYRNGFDAIRGVGGYFNQLVDGHLEYLHRASIYAPPAPGRESDPLRWTSSMRMLQLPNAPGFEPPSWAPRMLASYTTFQLRIETAFDNLGPLFDALQEHKDAWANTLKGWKTDPYGPKVDVRREFIANLGQRITMVTDYNVPISIDSERSVIAVEATNEQALGATLEKWMSKEPDVERRVVGPFVIWERVPQRLAAGESQVDVPIGFTPLNSEAERNAPGDKNNRDPVLPNSAVCVALGHLMMASDIGFLREILEGFAQRDRLASSAEYQLVADTMERLAPGERSGWSFGHTDEEIRPTFELIRLGKMPEAETMLGKLLNNILTTEVEREEGVVRKQRIDGSSLPGFEAVRRYFGPAGRVLRSDPDGWFFTAAVLNRESP